MNALYSYRTACVAAINAFALSNPGQVLTGDTHAWEYFSANALTELQAESNVTASSMGI